LIQYQRVTYGRTDRQTDERTDVQPIAITCFIIADARKTFIVCSVIYELNIEVIDLRSELTLLYTRPTTIHYYVYTTITTTTTTTTTTNNNNNNN